MRTWSNRPWNKDGKQLPLVHHASVAIEVKFRDFPALSRWVSQHVANTEGFRFFRIRVGPHVETADGAAPPGPHPGRRRCRHPCAAVRRGKLGLGKIRPVAIADAGMLGGNLHPEGDVGAARLRAAVAPGGGPDVELLPEHIEVSAAVDARFVGEDSEPTA